MDCSCVTPDIGPSLATTCYGGVYVVFMAILNELVRKRCDISEMCQRITPKTVPDSEYDFIVVGSGSSGSVIASRLSEVTNWKILLLEAGGDEPPGSHIPSMSMQFLGSPEVDWNYKTEPEENACLASPERRCTWARGKVLGGTSVINGMNYMRGVPRDYDRWAAAGNLGWSFTDVLPYFTKAEGNEEIGTVADVRYHGRDGPWTTKRFSHQPELTYDLLKAAKEVGIPVVDDLETDNWVGMAISQHNIKDDARLSTARAYLRPVRNRSNLHIMLNSTVTKVLVEEVNSKKVAKGVEFIYNNNVYRVHATKEVILSAGVINSPHLLMLSGIGPKEELQRVGIRQIHELPGVGKNLRNHVKFPMIYVLENVKDNNDMSWEAVNNYLLNKRGPLSSTGIAQVSARINSKYADPAGDFPDLQIYFTGYLAGCSRDGKPNAPADPHNPSAPKKIIMSPAVLHTKSVGHLSLRSNNSLDYPLIYAKYFSAPEDMETLLEGIRIVQKYANASVLRQKYGIKLDPNSYELCRQNRYDTDEFWKCAIRYYTDAENHQIGTCKMGPHSDPLAVVNPKLQVYGIENLRVMDASIIPETPSGRTAPTCVMLAEKGADLVRKRWLSDS